jgi:hypothetical protein
MGDGYTSGETSQFRADAQTVADYFISTPPFDTYTAWFNIFAIEVISNESGTDHPATASDEGAGPTSVLSVDNYLETSFDVGGTHRCIYSNQSGLIYSIANTNIPEWDFINVIVNTSYYGGCAGGIAFTTMNSNSPEVFVHEFGHMFGQLSDEYEYGSTSCTPGNNQNINTSQETDTSLLVWKHWLTNAPIPTPGGTNCSKIGLYEGAQYCATNWYRPKCECKMQSLNNPFCEVCFEQLIYQMSTMVNYIEDYIPHAPMFSICKGTYQNFHVDVLNNGDSTVRIQWLIDDVVVVNNNKDFVFNTNLFSSGVHEIKVITYDTTLYAKKPLTAYERIWNVNILNSPNAVVTTLDSLTFCEPGSAELQVSTGTGFTYKWLKDNTLIPGATSSSYTATSSGIYTAVVSNGTCPDSSNTITITANPVPSASISLAGNDTICSGSSAILNTTFCPTCTGQWLKNNVFISGATQSQYSASTPGSYSVSITDDSIGCIGVSSQLSIVVNPIPVVSFTGLPDTTCISNPTVSLVGTPSGGTFSGSGISGNIFNPSLSALGQQAISYNYTDGIGCSDTAVYYIFVDVCSRIHQVNNNDVFSLFPNPTNGKVVVEFQSDKNKELLIQIFDVMGKLVFTDNNELTGKFSKEIDVTNLSEGLYLFNIKSGEDFYIRRLIKIN